METIHPIDAVRNLKKRPEIGQRVRLSEGDIAQTKLLYKCYSEKNNFDNNIAINSSVLKSIGLLNRQLIMHEWLNKDA